MLGAMATSMVTIRLTNGMIYGKTRMTYQFLKWNYYVKNQVEDVLLVIAKIISFILTKQGSLMM